MNLSNRGYSIIKEETKSSILSEVRRDLTVKPFVNQDYGPKPNPFPIYAESKENCIFLDFMVKKSLEKL